MEHTLTLGAGCLLSYVLALTPLLFPAARKVAARPLREIFPPLRLDRRADDHIMVLRMSVVAVAGVLLGLVVDSDRMYWIVSGGIAVIGLVPVRQAAFQRGTHRMLGTIVGALLGMLSGFLHRRAEHDR